MAKSVRAGKRVLACISRFLKRELKLAINPLEDKDTKVDECEFLGAALYVESVTVVVFC